MAISTSEDLHCITQVAEAAIAETYASLPLLKTGIVTDVRGMLPGPVSGDSCTFPYWNSGDTSGFAQNAVRNSRTGLTPSELILSSYSETSETKCVSVDADKFAVGDASDNFLKHLALVVAKEFGRAVQSSLITKLVASGDVSEHVSLEGTMSVRALLSARCKWAESASEINPVCALMSTSQFNDLCLSEDFKTLAQTPIVRGPGEDWSLEPVAVVHGIRCYLCDSLGDDGSGYYYAFLFGPACCGLWTADNPVTETIAHAGSSVRTYDSSFRFCTTIWRHAPRRAVRIKAAISGE